MNTRSYAIVFILILFVLFLAFCTIMILVIYKNEKALKGGLEQTYGSSKSRESNTMRPSGEDGSRTTFFKNEPSHRGENTGKMIRRDLVHQNGEQYEDKTVTERSDHNTSEQQQVDQNARDTQVQRDNQLNERSGHNGSEQQQVNQNTSEQQQVNQSTHDIQAQRDNQADGENSVRQSSKSIVESKNTSQQANDRTQESQNYLTESEQHSEMKKPSEINTADFTSIKDIRNDELENSTQVTMQNGEPGRSAQQGDTMKPPIRAESTESPKNPKRKSISKEDTPKPSSTLSRVPYSEINLKPFSQNIRKNEKREEALPKTPDGSKFMKRDLIKETLPTLHYPPACLAQKTTIVDRIESIQKADAMHQDN